MLARFRSWGLDSFILGTLLFLVATSFVSFFDWNHLRIDATAYWQAGVHLRTSLPLYAVGPVAAIGKAYLYPPAFAAAFAPLTLLPPLWGYATWMALELLFAVLLARECFALAELERETSEERRIVLALGLAALLVALVSVFGEGQASLLVVLLSAASLRAFEDGRSWRAALFLAAATNVKIVPIVLAIPFLLWLGRRILLPLGISLFGVALLPLGWRIGTDGVGRGAIAFAHDYSDWWHSVLHPALTSQTIAGVEQFHAPNYSLIGTLVRWFGSAVALSVLPNEAARTGPLLISIPRPVISIVSATLGITLVGGALFLSRRAKNRTQRISSAALVLLAVSLSSVTLWEHGFVVVALVTAALWRLLFGNPHRVRWVGWSLVPLMLTMGVPLACDLSGHPNHLREWGTPTIAALALFAVVTWKTVRFTE